jgi:hypothetical protein
MRLSKWQWSQHLIGIGWLVAGLLRILGHFLDNRSKNIHCKKLFGGVLAYIWCQN